MLALQLCSPQLQLCYYLQHMVQTWSLFDHPSKIKSSNSKRFRVSLSVLVSVKRTRGIGAHKKSAQGAHGLVWHAKNNIRPASVKLLRSAAVHFKQTIRHGPEVPPKKVLRCVQFPRGSANHDGMVFYLGTASHPHGQKTARQRCSSTTSCNRLQSQNPFYLIFQDLLAPEAWGIK